MDCHSYKIYFTTSKYYKVLKANKGCEESAQIRQDPSLNIQSDAPTTQSVISDKLLVEAPKVDVNYIDNQLLTCQKSVQHSLHFSGKMFKPALYFQIQLYINLISKPMLCVRNANDEDQNYHLLDRLATQKQDVLKSTFRSLTCSWAHCKCGGQNEGGVHHAAFAKDA